MKLLDKADQFGHILASVAENGDMSSNYQQVWSGLGKVMAVAIDPAPKEEAISNFKENARKWGQVYVTCFGGRAMTTYIHLLVAHVHQYLAEYGSFGKFGNWAAEGIHSPIKRWILSRSPRAGGRGSHGVAFYAMRHHVLKRHFQRAAKHSRRLLSDRRRDIRQRLQAKARRAAKKLAMADRRS